MIDLNNANAYFTAHTARAKWAEYSAEQKQAAIMQARRDLSRAFGRAMRDDEPPYAEGDTIREEFAVYEQALFILLRDTNPDGGGIAVPSLDPNEKQATPYTLASGRNHWSEQALAWLGAGSRVMVVQG